MTRGSNRPLRTVLYVPAHSPKHLERAIESSADAVIVDLEDGVDQADKAEARVATAGAVDRLRAAGRHVIIRINAMDTPWWAEDLDVAMAAGPDAIQLPKAGRSAAVELVRALDERSWEVPVWAMVERVRDVLAVRELAREPGVEALVIGTADLCKELGLAIGADPPELVGVRQLVVDAARAQGTMAFDGVHVGDAASAFEAGVRSRTDGLTGRTLYDARHVRGVAEAYGD